MLGCKYFQCYDGLGESTIGQEEKLSVFSNFPQAMKFSALTWLDLLNGGGGVEIKYFLLLIGGFTFLLFNIGYFCLP